MRRAAACLAGVLAVLLIGTMNEPVQAAERRHTNKTPHAPKETPLAVRAVPARAGGPLRPQTKPAVLRSYTWPAAREATVSLGGRSTLPVAVTPTADVPKVRIRMRGQDDSARLGLTGVLFEVGRADGRAVRGSVQVAVDASPFEAAIGGGWASRLHLVALPNCALTTPGRPACRTATALPGSQAGPGHVARASVPVDAAGSLVALVAGASGGSGSYAASPLDASSSWGAGTQSGSFTWSYPLRVPPGVNGPEPQLAISYDSGSVDGRTAATNAQPTWLGEGFALGSGYIERSYASCQDDRSGGNNDAKTGDLCWKTDTVSVSLAGHSGEIIKDGSSGEYRMVNDDGSRIERLTGATNSPDNDGEYWKLTTSDGTQYFFGKTKRYASDTQADTGATWTVPVAGNQAGEPCHATAFKDSFCSQAWRWNLDYVVDPHGNTMSYTYAREGNRYQQEAAVAADAKPAAYTAGGYLTGITYGTRAGSEADPAPARVVFGTAERCLPDTGFACTPAQLTAANAARWPDVPFDQICTSTSSCGTNGSPTFFSRKRLTSVTTQILTAAGGYTDVDLWTFAQDFYDPADSSADGLELTGITHTGKYGTSAALPSITFGYEMFRNRVNGLIDGPTMYKPRLTRVVNETGGEISPHYDVSLGAGHLCSSATLPSSPSANGTRCYPSYWTPEGASSPTLTWFYKYVVDQVGEKDLVGGAVDTVTSINYVGDAAWRYDDNEITPAKYRTWSDWRGYGTVEVSKGDASTPKTLTRTVYLRGMGGNVTDSKGGTTADADRLAGSALETSVFNGSSLVSTTISRPSIGAPTATAGSKKATVVGPGVTDTYTTVYGGPERHTRVTVTTDPTYGTATQVNDEGDLSTTADDLCTRYGYARNTTAWITAAVNEEQQAGVACSVASPAAGDLLHHSRTRYDGGAWGAAPTRGLVTQVDELQTAGGSDFGMRSKATYDAYGRVRSATDAMGHTTDTAYTQLAVSGQSYTGGTVRAGTTDPKGFIATSDISPAWGVPVTETDINGKVTSLAYDGLGRLVSVWTPSRPKAAYSGTPSMRFGYSITKSAPSVVSTQELLASAVEPPTYLTSYQIFDGMLRPRQTQAREASGQGGRIITENEYDARGLVVRAGGPYYATGSPGGTLVQLTDVQKGAWHQLTYDQAERPVTDVFMSTNVEKFRTTTTYGGSFVSVDPPDGQQPSTTWTDARGRTTAVWKYHGNSPNSTLGYDETRYGYDRAGRLTRLTAPNGAVWDYAYDLRGRLIRTDDPDRGVTTMTYNANDQVVTSTDARGSTIWTDYDVLGRVVQTRKNDAGGTQLTARVYDTIAGAKGKLASSTRYANGNAYTSAVTGYDEAYRPTSGTLTIPAAEGALAGVYETENKYTGNGSIATAELPAVPQVGWGAETLSLGYDAQVGKPSSLASGSAGSIVAAVARSSYGEGLLYSLGQADKDIWFGYAFEEGTRRLVAQTAQRKTGTGYDVNLSYTYDKGGNVTSAVDAAPAAPESQCYTYDYAAQLTAAWTPAQGTPCSTAPSVSGLGGPAPYWHSYTYDNGGNRKTETVHSAFGDIAKSYTYAPVSSTGKGQPHTLTKVDNTSYTYDATGNTKTSGGKTFTWDEEGRLASTADSSYVYDADGDRLIRTEGTKKTLYLDNTEVQLDTSSGAVTATRYYEFDGRTVAMRQSGGGLRAVLSDNQGSPIWTADFATAADTRRRRYYPFGADRVGFSQVTWPGERGYVDGVKDTSTGTTHLGAREYDPAIGRFLSVDPVLDNDAPNPYAYSRNNPVTLSDPDGLEAGSWCNTPQCSTHEDNMRAGKEKPCMGECYPHELSDHDIYQNHYNVLSSQVNAASHRHLEIKKRLVEAAKKLGKVLMDELGITAGLDCFTKGDLGACAETAVNVLLSSVGSMAAKAMAKYAFRLGKAKAVGTLLFKLAKDIYSGVKGFFKTGEELKESKAALEAFTSCVRRSFTAETRVLLADGTTKPIAEIHVGDKVLATDPATGKTHAEKVTARHVNTDTDLVDLTVKTATGASAIVHTTARHPFWSPQRHEWVGAAGLAVREKLAAPTPIAAPVVTAVRAFAGSEAMYNLTVADLHTFYVLAGNAPVLVHNCPAKVPSLKQFPDVSHLRGADPEDVLDAIPDHWLVSTPKKVPAGGDGIRFSNPKAPGQTIIYEEGWAGHPDPVHQGPYLRVSDGTQKTYRIPLKGNPGL